MDIRIIYALLAGYIIGNFSPAYILVRIIKKGDIRNFGSGNAGMANTNRVLGFKWALLVFALDALKGVAAVLVGRLFFGEIGGLIGGLGAVIGHNWPVVLGFHGGKGVATSAGVAMALSLITFGILLGVFILVVAVWRYMSLGSIMVGILLPLSLLIFGNPVREILLGIILAAMILFQHRANIQRLLTGSERKLSINPSGGA
jgi:acyl phosphate:glycerol-3-phosphate acyltransferase